MVNIGSLKRSTSLMAKVAFLGSVITLFMILGGANPLAQSDDLNQELKGYWRFDEGRGEIAHDETAFQNDGRVEGPSWVVGLVEFGLNYYGQRGLAVKVPDDASLDVREKLTLTCWVCLSELLARESEDERFSLFAKPFEGAYSLSIDRDGGRLLGAVSLAGENRTLEGETFVPYDRWVHVAFSYDSETGEARLYLNGKLDRAGEIGPGLIDVNTSTLLLGSALDPSSSHAISVLPGILDEARVYQRVLLPEEIRRLASEPALAPEQPCGNCYSPLAVEDNLQELAQKSRITQEQFFRWLLMLLNTSETLPLDAPIDDIVSYFLAAGVIPGIFPLDLSAPVTKGEAALLMLLALELETPLLDQLLLSTGLQAAEEVALEIAVREGLLPPGDPNDLLTGVELGVMSSALLIRLETAPPPFFSAKDITCVQIKRLSMRREPPPPPEEPPSSS